MIDHPVTVFVCITLIVLAAALLMVSPAIHKWERVNNYPYGKLCDVYRNCRNT